MTSLLELPLETPAFVYDERAILNQAALLRQAGERSGCRMLYSVKALPFLPLLQTLAPVLDGFSVSSLFEARLAALAGGGALHLTTPGLKAAEMAEICQLCDTLAFNSLEQFQRLAGGLSRGTSPGLRVNPGLSFLADQRYDPCRPHSKLGVPLPELERQLAGQSNFAQALRGLHVHNAFSSRSFEPMTRTFERLEATLLHRLPNLEWINLGGGYLFQRDEDLEELCRISRRLTRDYGLRVLFEPGKGLVGEAGYLVASVIDVFISDGKTIAVLDTSVNHIPEVFEYQRRPEPGWDEPASGETAILAGCTCLAGDLFGEFRFPRRPALGDRLVFRDVGAYSLIKANRFNGYNLPAIYAWHDGLELRLLKQYSFGEYLHQWGAD